MVAGAPLIGSVQTLSPHTLRITVSVKLPAPSSAGAMKLILSVPAPADCHEVLALAMLSPVRVATAVRLLPVGGLAAL